jgi:hypothetical protein
MPPWRQPRCGLLRSVRVRRAASHAARRASANIREDLEVAHARAHLAVALRTPHLRVEFRNAALDFGDQVVDADPVLLGLLETTHRLVLAREELVDARGLFEERAPFGRLAREDRVDLALRHDRVRTRSETGAHQQLHHVAHAHLVTIDEVLALARTVRATRDLDFAVLDRQAVVAVVERHGDFGQAERLAFVVAGEDHVFEFARAQALARRFAEDPAKRIDHVRLAGSVRPDNRGNAAGKFQRRRFGKRFKAEALDLL